MTTNWREKLEAAADQDIDDLGFVVGPEKVLLSDALALLERAYAEGRAEAFRESQLVCENYAEKIAKAHSKETDTELDDDGQPIFYQRTSLCLALSRMIQLHHETALAAARKGTP